MKSAITRLQHSRLPVRFNAQLIGLLTLWVVMLAAFAVFLPAFYTSSNLTSILQFTTIVALVTLGQTLVILCGGGGIDLSVGGMVSLCSLFLAYLLVNGVPSVLAVLIVVIFGCLLGATNGFLITRIRIAPLIATLGTFYAFGGTALAIVGGAPISGVPASFSALGQNTILGFPLHTLFVLIPAFLVLTYVLTQLPYGRWVYATGRNEIGARLVGIPVDTLRFSVYVLSGLLCSFASVVATSWLLSARPNIGDNLELQSLAAVLLGGTSIFGGRGSLLGSLLAVYFLVTLQVGLQLANINAIWQLGAVGLFLILSVLLDQLTKGK